jgi:hypothetical protein
MHRIVWFAVILACVLAFGTLAPAAQAQGKRPYIGYVYPAGGQQGTTFQIRLGGQGMDEVRQILVSGQGVSVRSIEFHRRLNNEELKLLKDQLQVLKVAKPAPSAPADGESAKMIAALELRNDEFVARPACPAIASLTFAEVSIAADAAPGRREIRLVSRRGVSNPLVFYVGQLPEYSRKPMQTASLQILGKESQSLRKRPPSEIEDRISLPCTVNGQIASGEVNRYRFRARKGQRLVITTLARQLIPYIADTVPGYFQPVLVLNDPGSKEVANDDHYSFKADPLVFYKVPASGDYVLSVHDNLYRGREDFIYRICLGELPFLTSIFPLGRRSGKTVPVKLKGWNLEHADLSCPAANAAAGIHQIAALTKGVVSNHVPFAVDNLPECFEKENNNTAKQAQKIELPVIVNGRINKPGDRDVFQFRGKSGDAVVAEVYARRLDSPLDSVLSLTDSAGALIASNDDHEDPGSGLNTHHADSYLMARLPSDGVYNVWIGDAARKGGEEYAYRLKVSAPQPDFALQVVPSSASMRSKGKTTVSVYALRKDGFNDPIKLGLKEPPPGFSAPAATLKAADDKTQLTLATSLKETEDPVDLLIEGRAKIGDRESARNALPAEDQMQAFLWRSLVPAGDFKAMVFDPDYQAPPARVLKVQMSESLAKWLQTKPGEELKATPYGENKIIGQAGPATPATSKTKAAPATPPAKERFTKAQVAGRLKQLKQLWQENLLTDDFYLEKLKECQPTP